jgi:tryptophanyl-tRNA synthetase
VADNGVVNPWNVSGEIDYNKLIERFGTRPIDQELLERLKRHTGGLHFHLRRGVFYSHRDLDEVLDEYEKGNRFVIYTGRGPSGPVHLGHLVPWIFTRYLQQAFDAKLLFQFTDDEKLMLNPKLTEEDVDHWTFENALDLMALGFEPEKTEFIVNRRQSDKVYRVALKVARRTTVSTVKAIFGFDGDTSPSFMFFPAMQAAPCFIESEREGKPVPCLIPAGIDQDPFWRMTRDTAAKLGYPKPAQIHCRLLPGLLEGGKMSSSVPESAIYTTDEPNMVEEKVNKVKKLGHGPEVCPIYQYYYFLFEESDEALTRIAANCGAEACIQCKAQLIERVNNLLVDHRAKREKVRPIVTDLLGF